MEYITRKDVYKMNSTMKKVSEENIICNESDLDNIMQGLGLELDNNALWIASRSDVLCLASHFVALGRIYERNNIQWGKAL